MSSMRNAVQRRNHKERAQPLERQKWGLLEKHKDYSKRAADHNLKKRKIKALQNKASERNEDEFYFGMLSNTTDRGVKRAKRGEGNGGTGELSRETVLLMKTQDVGYLRTMLQKTRMERQRLEKEVIIADHGVKLEGVKTAVTEFGEDGRPIQNAFPASKKSADDDLDDLDDDLADLDGLDDDSEDDEGAVDDNTLTPEEAKKKHRRDVQRRKVAALKDREQSLTLALRGLERQRARMNGDGDAFNKDGIHFRARGRKK